MGLGAERTGVTSTEYAQYVVVFSLEIGPLNAAIDLAGPAAMATAAGPPLE